MKKLNLGRLKLTSEEVLEREHMAGIYGGLGSSQNCWTNCVEGCGGNTDNCDRDTVTFFCQDNGGPQSCSCW
ncbi:hypothetical protein SAMN03080617_03502 [Algoriphagus alkaliphilus]|uniref:Natural product n=1 Tax=Algoriphagus alkaliphilus TaxID=279824 RepID=A0A1G5ZAV4_9BACT|nr:hypothetical protein SAMN03080617_03502 [Algoriphagus alkaliphilus]